MKISSPDGATPLDDISGLIPTSITSKYQLDKWEHENILEATRFYFSKKRKIVLNNEWLKQVHKNMFSDTWTWAGAFRNTNLNIGVNSAVISTEVKKLCDDFEFWKANNTYTLIEQTVRLHHRLVKIHPFANGNGRHARLVADIMLFNNDHPLPNWPNNELVSDTGFRKKYIDCLKLADNGDITPLLILTKSFIKE